MSGTDEISRLLGIMARLRDRRSGCPWDVAQSFSTIAPYTIEEAYEVAEAAEIGDPRRCAKSSAICSCRSCSTPAWPRSPGSFAFADVARAHRRQDGAPPPPRVRRGAIDSAAAQTVAWEEQKAEERRAKAAASGQPASALDGVGSAFLRSPAP